MDRYNRKEDGCKITKLRVVIVLSGIVILSLLSGIVYAEEQKEEERKIELEKMQIFGVLERPNVIFPTRWKDPDAPEERIYKLKRSFKEEIMDFVDMDKIRDIRHQTSDIRLK